MNLNSYLTIGNVAVCFAMMVGTCNAFQTATIRTRPAAPIVPQTGATAASPVEIKTQDGRIILPPDAVLANQALPSAATDPTAPPAIVPLTRLQAIQQMTIDLRPSHRLQTWSNPNQEDESPRPPSPLGSELGVLQWRIANSDWTAIGEYLRGLPEDEQTEIYQIILTKVTQTPSTGAAPAHPAGQAFRETNALGLDDVFGLLTVSPNAHTDATIASIGRMVALSVASGNTIDQFLIELASFAAADPESETTDPSDEESANEAAILTHRQAAKLLQLAGQIVHVEPFLPSTDEAIEADDAEALNLLSACFLAKFSESRETVDLEHAWQLTQAVLASASTDEDAQRAALTQAVNLSSRVREELGQQWLDDSFSSASERGRRILGTVGALNSQALSAQPTNPTYRSQHLKLVSTAVQAMMATQPDLGQQWQNTLNMLMAPWLDEAELAYRFDRTSSRGPLMQYDAFGNIYFMDESQNPAMQQARQNQPQPIPVAQLLEFRPSDEWIELLDASLQPAVHNWLAKLYLKVNEPENAFPYIEQLSASQPDIAIDLANEFLSVWARTHDPNSNRRYQSPIYRIYGFNANVEGIPLTRSKQERNLAELAEWIRRLEAIGDIREGLEDRLLVRAFTVCHSSAEVYRIDVIESVFGEIGSLEPETLASLIQQMRRNLAGLWRDPEVQKQNRTNRRKQDIEAEVLNGYMVATEVIDNALVQHGEHWTLLLAKAALVHDEVVYRNELAKSSSFTENRLAAMESFRLAAEAYMAELPELELNDESAEVFETWFFASLGACDVAQLDEEKVPLLTEIARIREAMQQLPAESLDRHLGSFANTMFTMLRSVNPSIKHRYLRQGFEIVGDHDQAVEAKKVFEYYEDLVTEIQLESQIDGTSNVGHEQPFGVYVNIRHTVEIERESGGFGRYLQNQNNMQYAYNYGRPTENYRDKFEDSVREALGEHFEVLSVTFQTEDVSSKSDREYGWRVTPYAYVLLKPRGEEIDEIPPFKLDLDFLDASGYVVLPIESATIPIDSNQQNADAREYDVLKLVQTLDERQAGEGKLVLEVKATTHGLPPNLEDLVDIQHEGFDVSSIDDEGTIVSQFDAEADDTVVQCERLWTITLKGREDLQKLPDEFQFADLLVDANTVTFQRYNDADLESVEQVVELRARYGQTDRTVIIIAATCAVIGLLGLIGLVIALKTRGGQGSSQGAQLPDDLTAFTAIGMLRDIHRNNGLDENQREQLESDIHRLESAYFAPDAKNDANPREVAESWLKRSTRS